MRRFVIKPMKKLEEMTDQIGKGNLEARVNINTGDEFEKLGHRFNTMAPKTVIGHDPGSDAQNYYVDPSGIAVIPRGVARRPKMS